MLDINKLKKDDFLNFITIFEKRGLNVDYYNNSNNDIAYFIIHGFTGEGVEFSIEFDNIQDLFSYIDGFDPEEEVLYYIEGKEYKQEIGLLKGLKDFIRHKKLLEDIKIDILKLTTNN